MPKHPVVGVWLSELSGGRYVQGRPMDDATHWIEGAIELRVRHGKEEGWYPFFYPVTAEFWFEAGRAVGLPKRHASATIATDGSGWLARATPGGSSAPAISMDWQPGPDADRPATSLAFRAALDPLFTLNPALRGPELERVQYLVSPPSSAQTAIPGGAPAYTSASGPTAGSVRLRLASNTDAVQESDLPKIFPPHSSLADIVNPDQTVAGDYYFYAVSLSDTSAVIGSGGYGARGRSKGTARAPKRCLRRRAMVVRVAARRVRLVRAYVDGRRVAVHILHRGRIRLSLRRIRRGVHHLRIVAYTHRRHTVVRGMRFRIC